MLLLFITFIYVLTIYSCHNSVCYHPLTSYIQGLKGLVPSTLPEHCSSPRRPFPGKCVFNQRFARNSGLGRFWLLNQQSGYLWQQRAEVCNPSSYQWRAANEIPSPVHPSDSVISLSVFPQAAMSCCKVRHLKLDVLSLPAGNKKSWTGPVFMNLLISRVCNLWEGIHSGLTFPSVGLLQFVKRKVLYPSILLHL